MAEQKYRVIGTHAVAGIKPGGTGALPPGTNVRALIKGGHVEPVAEQPKPEKKTEPKS